MGRIHPPHFSAKKKKKKKKKGGGEGKKGEGERGGEEREKLTIVSGFNLKSTRAGAEE